MKYLMLATLSLFFYQSKAQQTTSKTIYPEKGKPCPDFVLNNIKYYPKTQATLNDFKGKWLVLDFWNKGCGACVLSFPRVSAEQKEFGDRVQFMMVGIQDKEEKIEPMFKRFRDREHLIMPCVFDSALAKKWDIYTAPYIIVVDPGGIVQAITGALEKKDIEALLAGRSPALGQVYRVHEEIIDKRIPFDSAKPLLTNNNGGNDTDFMYRSLLAKFSENQRPSYPPDNLYDKAMPGRFQVHGQPLFFLFNYAYYGHWRPDSGYALEPVLEIKDSCFFNYSAETSKNLFSYSLIIHSSKVTKNQMQHIMQNDLENCFGYKASIENRPFPCWKMIATDKAKKSLESKGGKPDFEQIIPKIEYQFTNLPFNDFFRIISAGLYKELMINETGILGNIDIHINCVTTDMEDVKKELHKKGIELIPSTITKKVLVIRDQPASLN